MSNVRAQALVNMAAIERNCEQLRSQLAGECALCAVVKADGYGHGGVQAARAALAGGASWLAVATAQEARELRAAGLEQERLLVMGALSERELSQALDADADVTVWRERDVQAVAAAGGGRVHVKLDSGMGRLGTRDPDCASRVVEVAASTPGVTLSGAMTHFATADEDDDEGYFGQQLQEFTRWALPLKRRWPEIIVHAANSAALLRDVRSHFDMVRCGIAVYGLDPLNVDAGARGLQPALELRSYVAEVKLCREGDSVGYGRRFIAPRDTYVGVLPIGYGDGWRRSLTNNGEALIDGRRRPIVGTVSMDNLTVDLGSDPAARELLGAAAVLVGRDAQQQITAEQVAARLGTINYEVTCGLSARVPRLHHRDGSAVGAASAAEAQSA
jgi:alanine racemase